MVTQHTFMDEMQSVFLEDPNAHRFPYFKRTSSTNNSKKETIQIKIPFDHHVGWCHTWFCWVPSWIASWPFRCSAVHSAKGTALQPKPTDAVLSLLLQDEENCKPWILRGRAADQTKKSKWVPGVFIYLFHGLLELLYPFPLCLPLKRPHKIPNLDKILVKTLGLLGPFLGCRSIHIYLMFSLATRTLMGARYSASCSCGGWDWHM